MEDGASCVIRRWGNFYQSPSESIQGYREFQDYCVTFGGVFFCCLLGFPFDRAKEVEAAIRAKDLGPALRWCDDNGSRLRKLESRLEFRVRERAFLEMVRANKNDDVRHLHLGTIVAMIICKSAKKNGRIVQ